MKKAYAALALALVAVFAVHCGGEATPPVQDPSTTTATTPSEPSTSTPSTPSTPSIEADAGAPSAEPAK